ncbi:MAG: inorganic phosphate transporter [Bacteroidia bacterium]|nr:inorganic phosphate transporter [Bacteroidia bacterium]
MFGLEIGFTILLILCLVAACSFEFVNGFHDTANAVATVIYTNSLKPVVAVVWSGIFNFAGVFFGGIAVAMGIVNLLPVESLIDQNISHSIAMVLALLLSAIAWNLLTWYFGIPCSSSHTLIAAILGVGITFSLLPESGGNVAVNWKKAQEIGASLLLSPLFGFSTVILLMTIMKAMIKDSSIFKEPAKDAPPPTWIRAILILTCTAVSFFHGSNDGQKGVGLVMLILIGIVPAYFALDNQQNPADTSRALSQIEYIISSADSATMSPEMRAGFVALQPDLDDLASRLPASGTMNEIPEADRFKVRSDILKITRKLEKMEQEGQLVLPYETLTQLKAEIKNLRKTTDYAPSWVILIISLSLGIGTMVGWKRIVVTIGEKIGKQHLTYAQGASAEIVAASTIALSTYMGLPVSTTHVLSSGIAGSMVASQGIKNLQMDTIRNILMAWLLTFPVVLVLSGSLFLLFRLIL